MRLAPIALASALGAYAAPGKSAQSMQPGIESAKLNAYHIFNAVHAVGRQWDSSILHNGFSFVPTVVPKGTILYHGSRQQTKPEMPEWLAFEIEHAENFARSGKRRRRPGPPGPPPKDDDGGFDTEKQTVMSSLRERNLHGGDGDDDDDDEPAKYVRGYLHTYQAPEDLNLILIDGMSAGKVDMGTLDSQDYVLREKPDRGGDGFDEWPRAQEICDMVTEWGYEGVIRLEIGFEIILCDFNNVNLISATRTFIRGRTYLQDLQLDLFQWARAVGQRYDGIGGDRVRFDFSSMVSGYFFPINISSTNPQRPDLIRLGANPTKDLKSIKDHLQAVLSKPRRFTVKWQAVVDMIVTRFKDRFAYMASASITPDHFEGELDVATFLYANAPSTPDDISIATPKVNLSTTEEAIDRCASHYLLPALLLKDQWSSEDELLYAAIRQVMEDICYNMFTIWEFFPDDKLRPDNGEVPGDDDDDRDETRQQAFEAGRQLIRDMMSDLNWPAWKKTSPCPVNEVLFVAMWPFGDEEDHWNPGCRTIDDLQIPRGNYWGLRLHEIGHRDGLEL